MKAARLPAAVLAAAVAAMALTTAPAAVAVSSPSPAPTASSVPGSTAPGSPAQPALSQAARLAIGGPDMASSGVVVNYPAGGGPRLPQVPASAWVIADAGTGQVLAARDPHGEFGPASTLKVLTAVTLLPLLKPGAMVTTSKLAAAQQPNVAGLIAGRAY